MTLDLDGRRVRCTVDEVAAHRHPEHAVYQLTFSLVDAATVPPVARLMGALRSIATARTARPVAAFA